MCPLSFKHIYCFLLCNRATEFDVAVKLGHQLETKVEGKKIEKIRFSKRGDGNERVHLVEKNDLEAKIVAFVRSTFNELSLRRNVPKRRTDFFRGTCFCSDRGSVGLEPTTDNFKPFFFSNRTKYLFSRNFFDRKKE